MKCKVGDLAFIRNAIRVANLGRVVTCKVNLGYFIRGETIMHNGEAWIAFETDFTWVVTGNLETLYGTSTEALIPDSWLTPIRTDPLDATEHTKELDRVS